KQNITINIIDFSGRTIGNIYSGNLDKGQNSITFAPSKNDFSLTSGSYLFNIQGEYYNYTGKIILMK
ncbi:MAG: hypothetical protein QG635_2492, partial [Bacteroidota bacterium]|nr:hypothetical protein [Bacteroidota bacterium]